MDIEEHNKTEKTATGPQKASAFTKLILQEMELYNSHILLATQKMESGLILIKA
jgi:hypothetical protein